MRTLVILNPRAGNAHQRKAVTLAVDVWRQQGWEVELVETRYAGHAPQLASDGARDGFDLVVAAGGDGTVNEVVNGLAYTQTALGVLPVGTGNVWVRELRLPLQPERAAELLARGKIYQLDLGRAGDRFFLLMAGVGFDAAVTREVLPEAKRKMGILAYMIKAFSLASHYSGAQAQVLIDGKPMEQPVLMVVIGNSRLYGGYIRIAHQASLSDGLLDVCLLKGRTLMRVPQILTAIWLKRERFSSAFEYYKASEITVNCSRSMDVQVDGDAIGHTPMVFRSAPASLRALIPPTVAEHDLFEPRPSVTTRLRRRLDQLARRPE